MEVHLHRSSLHRRSIHLRYSWSSNAFAAPPRRSTRPWRVLHTCDALDDVRVLIEGELAIGMRPSVVTRDGLVFFADTFRGANHERAVPSSLLNAWNDVRHWRRIIIDADPAFDCDIVHAHSFTAGMAGVRNCPAVVYEISSFIEEHARTTDLTIRERQQPLNPQDNAQTNSWLGRSFRVAEQFVISRAAAVVTRTNSMKQAALRRGAVAENTFVIPEPIDTDFTPPLADRLWLLSHDIDDGSRSTIFYAPSIASDATGSTMNANLLSMIEAFARICAEAEDCHFLIHVHEVLRADVVGRCESLGIADRVHIIEVADSAHAFAAANVVITDGNALGENDTSEPPTLTALRYGVAVLGADLPANRDVSPNGRGCLWYRDGDFRDLAHRAIFLATNQDFRNALAASGRTMVVTERSPEAIAEQYDAVYRHAAARRKSGGLQTPAVRLVPLEAMR